MFFFSSRGRANSIEELVQQLDEPHISNNEISIVDPVVSRINEVTRVAIEEIEKLTADNEKAYEELKKNIELEADRLRLEHNETSTALKNDTSYQLPANAQLLFNLLLKEGDREAIIGDLSEKYEQKIVMRGKRYAYLWLYNEIARSAWPLFRQFVIRMSGQLVRAKRIR